MNRINHIGENVKEKNLKTISEYLMTCKQYKEVCGKSAKRYALKHKLLQFASGLIVTTGIGSTFAVGPLGLVIISGVIFVLAFGEKMNWDDKAKNCKWMAEEFGKKQKRLIACRRGTEKFDHDKFSSDLALLEEMVELRCPAMTRTTDRWERKHPAFPREEAKEPPIEEV